MSRFIETIQVHQGSFLKLEYHQERFERSRLEVLGLKSHPALDKLINLPRGLEHGTYKCRITYGKDIELIEFEPQRLYQVRSLRLVHSEHIAYAYKHANRDELKRLFGQRGGCDDILIVKQNCMTDSHVANVLFWDGKHWFTPDTPLLPGIMRASLLREGVIRECRITVADLPRYEKIKLINAMNDLENGPEIPVESIH